MAALWPHSKFYILRTEWTHKIFLCTSRTHISIVQCLTLHCDCDNSENRRAPIFDIRTITQSPQTGTKHRNACKVTAGVCRKCANVSSKVKHIVDIMQNQRQNLLGLISQPYVGLDTLGLKGRPVRERWGGGLIGLWAYREDASTYVVEFS